MRYFDTHAHFEGTPAETAAVLSRASAAGVTRVLAMGGSEALNASALATAAAPRVPPSTAMRTFFSGLSTTSALAHADSNPRKAHNVMAMEEPTAVKNGT